jgi:hypothetical protein
MLEQQALGVCAGVVLDGVRVAVREDDSQVRDRSELEP